MNEITMGNEGDQSKLPEVAQLAPSESWSSGRAAERSGADSPAQTAVSVVRSQMLGPTRQMGVLVVERDPDLQWRLARTLTVQGHRVVGTSSGDGALALVAEWPVDLVLIDEDLPGMNGLEVAARIQETHPQVPVVLIANVEPRVSRIPGVVAWLSKPFQPAALIELLEQLAPLGDALAEPAE